jgi:membrane protein DedA with SNARE-associated domain
MMVEIAQWLVSLIHGVGYTGIFAAMFLGNALVPIPVEFIMIPAGFLAEQGKMQLGLLLACAISGDVLGSLFSYTIAYHYGRRFLYVFGKYLFFNHDKMEMLDRFFASHGEISVLTGRLVPGLRHFMAFPAGLSHMNVKRFLLYTGVGGGIWTGILIGLGWIIGGNEAMVRHYLPYVEGVMITVVVMMLIVYIRRHRRHKIIQENTVIKEATNGHA